MKPMLVVTANSDCIHHPQSHFPSQSLVPGYLIIFGCLHTVQFSSCFHLSPFGCCPKKEPCSWLWISRETNAKDKSRTKIKTKHASKLVTTSIKNMPGALCSRLCVHMQKKTMAVLLAVTFCWTQRCYTDLQPI